MEVEKQRITAGRIIFFQLPDMTITQEEPENYKNLDLDNLPDKYKKLR